MLVDCIPFMGTSYTEMRVSRFLPPRIEIEAATHLRILNLPVSFYYLLRNTPSAKPHPYRLFSGYDPKWLQQKGCSGVPRGPHAIKAPTS